MKLVTGDDYHFNNNINNKENMDCTPEYTIRPFTLPVVLCVLLAPFHVSLAVLVVSRMANPRKLIEAYETV